MIEEAWKYLSKKLGKTGTLLIAFFVCGIYFATSYSSYIVTPDTLDQAKKELNCKLDKKAAYLEVKSIELELRSLQKEKSELEDKVDVPKPKARHLERLQDVNDQMKALDVDKKELLKVLETK